MGPGASSVADGLANIQANIAWLGKNAAKVVGWLVNEVNEVGAQ